MRAQFSPWAWTRQALFRILSFWYLVSYLLPFLMMEICEWSCNMLKICYLSSKIYLFSVEYKSMED
jgi:hypothetical protein